MDETCIFFEVGTNKTIANTGEKTIGILKSGSNNLRITVCLTICADGTKLKPFIVFKGKPNAAIENDLYGPNGILPEGVEGCCQEVAWMDAMNSPLWISRVWLPHVAEVNRSFLLLDDFACHKQPLYKQMLGDCGTRVEMIPPNYTNVLQPCDVGINKPFKTYIRRHYMNWCVQFYSAYNGIGKFPVPTRRDVALWVKLAWDETEHDILRWHRLNQSYGFFVHAMLPPLYTVVQGSCPATPFQPRPAS